MTRAPANSTKLLRKTTKILGKSKPRKHRFKSNRLLKILKDRLCLSSLWEVVRKNPTPLATGARVTSEKLHSRVARKHATVLVKSRTHAEEVSRNIKSLNLSLTNNTKVNLLHHKSKTRIATATTLRWNYR